MLIGNVILAACSNVTDRHGFPLKFPLIIVTKRGNLATFYPTQHHPSYTVPNTSAYKFWATLSNSPALGRISVSLKCPRYAKWRCWSFYLIDTLCNYNRSKWVQVEKFLSTWRAIWSPSMWGIWSPFGGVRPEQLVGMCGFPKPLPYLWPRSAIFLTLFWIWKYSFFLTTYPAQE